MKSRYLFITLSFVLTLLSTAVRAQELEHQAPSLQIGLDGLSFAKGTLDAQLIAELITSKQEEIKLKAVQNSFLSKIGGAGGTVYNFVDNVIREVVQEPDTEIRTRKIVEHTVNLVFVFSFVDFYLKHDSNENLELINEIADTNLKILNRNNKLNFSKGLDVQHLISNGVLNQSNNTAIKDSSDVLIAWLIDIGSEVVRNNTRIKELGLMNISYSRTYEYQNLYFQRKFKNSDTVYKNMENLLRQYTNFIGVVDYMLSSSLKVQKTDSKISNKDLSESISEKVSDIVLELNIVLASLIQHYDKIQIALKDNEAFYESQLRDIENTIQQLSAQRNYLNKVVHFINLNNPENIKDPLTADILFTITKKTIPIINEAQKYNFNLSTVQDSLWQLSNYLFEGLVTNYPSLNNGDYSNQFYKVIQSLYNFDKANAFSIYRDLLSSLEDTFYDERINDAISLINTFVKDFIVIGKNENGQEYINFNVESFLVKLQNLPDNKIHKVQFHFTVGTNTSFYHKTLVLNDSISLDNLSHVSEKIGIKFKIFNWGDWQPRTIGDTYYIGKTKYIKKSIPREPFVSNIHLIAYGSGILYNIINSSTNKAFNYPNLGVGTGITFFNNLDLNVSVGVPILSKGNFSDMLDYRFVNIGFDIQFTEYLEALNKKRKNIQTQKKLSKLQQL